MVWIGIATATAIGIAAVCVVGATATAIGIAAACVVGGSVGGAVAVVGGLGGVVFLFQT